MSEASLNPIIRLSRRHASMWASSWYVADDGTWQPIADVANDYPNINPFSMAPTDVNIAFRHLGLVKVSLSDLDIGVTWDLADANLKALESVISYLFECKHKKSVKLQFFHAGWCWEHYPSPQSAMRRVIQLQALRGEDPEAGIFMREHSLSELSTQTSQYKTPILNKGIELWHHHSGKLDFDDISVRRHVLPYVQLLSLDNDGVYRFEHIGTETLIAKLFGEVWRRSVIKTAALRSHADQEFEDAVSHPYDQVLLNGQPYHDHVRALLVRSHTDPLWISYRRLVVPYKASDGRHMLALYVAPDQNISIPLFNRHKLAVSTGDDPAR